MTMPHARESSAGRLACSGFSEFHFHKASATGAAPAHQSQPLFTANHIFRDKAFLMR